MYRRDLSLDVELSMLMCADCGGLHWDAALPPSWWQLHGWEEGDGWDEAGGPQEWGHNSVTSPMSGAKHKPSRAAKRRTLPEGLGRLVLQRHQHHPWGPGKEWREVSVGVQQGYKPPWTPTAPLPGTH